MERRAGDRGGVEKLAKLEAPDGVAIDLHNCPLTYVNDYCLHHDAGERELRRLVVGARRAAEDALLLLLSSVPLCANVPILKHHRANCSNFSSASDHHTRPRRRNDDETSDGRSAEPSHSEHPPYGMRPGMLPVLLN